MSRKRTPFQERVFQAYQALPRDDAGRLPSYRSLEERFRIPGAALSKTINAERENFTPPTIDAMARALRVPVSWLMSGDGPGPGATGSPAPTTVAYEDEPARDVVIEQARGRGVDERHLRALQKVRHHSPTPATEEWWWKELRRIVDLDAKYGPDVTPPDAPDPGKPKLPPRKR